MKARTLIALLLAATLLLGGCSWLKDEFFFTLSPVPSHPGLEVPASPAGP